MPISPGTRFGVYDVSEPIGSGGMGEIWRATDTNLKREVALKFLPQDFAADGNRLARFRREAEILAALNHPNIAQVYGLEKADGQTAIVMELVEGPTLEDRIALGPIPPDEAMGIALQIIGALEAAHDRHIVHRDLKPANVKLRADGSVKVLDFGISKTINPETDSGVPPVVATPAVTQTGVILGTAAYMSPEQARGKLVDERTDVWAFGCLLFEMLTGQPAFGGEDVMLTLARVLANDTNLDSIPNTISPAVRHTLKLCLEKDPRKRIADIRDVRLALDGRFETEYPGEVSPRPQAPLWKRALSPAVALVVGAAVLGSVWFITRPVPAPSIQPWTSVDTLPDGIRFNNPGLGLSVASAPDGSLYAVAAGGALYVRYRDDPVLRLLEQTADDAPVNPAFSPDGEWIAYWSPSKGQIRKVRVDGRAPPVSITNEPRSTSTLIWAPDDFLIYARRTNPGGEIVRVSANPGSEPEARYSHEAEFFRSLSLLSDGTLLVTSGSSDLIAVNLETGAATPVLPEGGQGQYVDTGYLVYADSGSILARTFDLATQRPGNRPVRLADDVYEFFDRHEFAVSASGNSLIFVRAIRPGSLLWQFEIIDARGNPVRPLGSPRNFLSGAVSRHGNRLAAVVAESALDQEISRRNRNLWIYELSGDSDWRQITFDDGIKDEPFWKDDDTLVYVSGPVGRRRIWQHEIAPSRDTPLSDGAPDGDHGGPVVSPDGDLIFTVVDPDTRVATTLIESEGRFVPLLGDGIAAEMLAFSLDEKSMAYRRRIGAQGSAGGNTPVVVEPWPRDEQYGPRSVASGENILGLDWVQNEADGTQTLIYLAITTTSPGALRTEWRAVDIPPPPAAPRNERALFPEGSEPNNAILDVVPIPGTDHFVMRSTVAVPETADDTDATSETTRRSPWQIVVITNFDAELKQQLGAP